MADTTVKMSLEEYEKLKFYKDEHIKELREIKKKSLLKLIKRHFKNR